MDLALHLGYSKVMSSVVIVGCDPAARYCVKRAAAQSGYSVADCGSVDEARAANEAAPFAAAIVDADCFRRLPQGNGALASAALAFSKLIVVCGLHRLAEFADASVFATLTTPFTIVDAGRVFERMSSADLGAHRGTLTSVGSTPGDAGAAGEARLGAAFERAVDQQLAEWGESQPTEIYEFFVRALERPLIARMLELTRGNQVATAARLGLNRNTLRKKLKYLGLLKSRRP